MICNGRATAREPEAWQALSQSSGPQDIWQIHSAIAGGRDHNAPEPYVANPEERCEAKWIKLSAQPDGTFTITNSRNNYSRTYKGYSGPRFLDQGIS